MLVGLRAVLADRDLRDTHINLLVLACGGLAGGVISTYISIAMFGVGALYGLMTATSLVCLQSLSKPAKKTYD